MCSVRSNSPRRGNALKCFKTAVILKCLKCLFLSSKLPECVSQTKILQSNVLYKVSSISDTSYKVLQCLVLVLSVLFQLVLS